jgi:aminoacrylate hydrolase
LSLTLRYDVSGEKDATPPVLLSSGLGGLGGYWAPQKEPLAAKFRVITYDQRGTGANPGVLPEHYSIAAMADDVVAILDDAGCDTVHFVGHALGGLIGLDLALRHPKRLASLVLINAWARLDAHTARCFDVRTAILRECGVETYVRAQPIFLHPAPYLSEHADRLRHEETVAASHFQGTDTLLRRIGALRRFDATARLSEIATPTVVMAARDDMLVPWTCSQALAGAVRGARLAMFEYGGHANNVTDPEPFNAALVDFLDGFRSLSPSMAI